MAVFLLLSLLQWQQRVSYTIKANLDTEEHSLKACEWLTYHNNSPYTLETLYVHLYANALKNENTIYAQEAKRLGYHRFVESWELARGYVDIFSITRNDDSLKFYADETIMAIPLYHALKSFDSITLKIDYCLKIPTTFSRIGYLGDHYEMVHWYPKICVFDEDGWHLDAFHAIGEFYGEFGCFDVEINLPGDYVIAATGERIDEKDKEFLDSLCMSNIKIDLGDRKVVRFRAENVHDFAWICDPNYLVKKYTVDSIDIYVFYLKHHEKRWNNAGTYAVDAVQRYNQWYGKYPYKNLSVVDGYYRDGVEYPNLVIIGMAEDPITRLFELVIIHEIGHQWFYGVLGSNEMDEAWLDEGFTTYTEIRYLEDKYGKGNSLIKLPFIPSLSRKYYHKFIYYVTQTNEIEKPILTPAYKFLDVPIAYTNSAYSKPALFLFNIEGILGKERFNRILKRYFKEYKFKHPKTKDFIRICEEESGQDMKSFFSQVLNSTDFCDWAVKKVARNRVEIENKGNLPMPVDVFVEAETGANVFRIDGAQKVHTLVLPEACGNIKKVTIDPYDYSLEPNHWNNYYPRKIRIKPIFGLPSFDSYQIFYIPFLWYGAYDGVTVGLLLFGAEFVDLDFVKGRHQWTFSNTYGIKSKKFYPGFSYKTPIVFKKGMRTRIHFEGSHTNDEDKLSGGFTHRFSTPFSRGPRSELENTLSYRKLNSYNSTGSIDWDLGRNIIFENCFKYISVDLQLNFGLSFTHEIIGSDWSYVKATAEIKKEIERFIPLTLRLFAGRIFGTAPTQERLFLSGAVQISQLADLFFNQQGYFSPQEHIHIPGDGNMRGYQTMHIKSDQLYCVNLEFPSKVPIRLFTDFGYYGDYAFDVGARLVLGPVSFNVPFYILSEEPWKFRWSIGF